MPENCWPSRVWSRGERRARRRSTRDTRRSASERDSLGMFHVRYEIWDRHDGRRTPCDTHDSTINREDRARMRDSGTLPGHKTFRNRLCLDSKILMYNSDPFSSPLIVVVSNRSTSRMRMDSRETREREAACSYRNIERCVEYVHCGLGKVRIQIDETIVLKAKDIYSVARTATDDAHGLRKLQCFLEIIFVD